MVTTRSNGKRLNPSTGDAPAKKVKTSIKKVVEKVAAVAREIETPRKAARQEEVNEEEDDEEETVTAGKVIDLDTFGGEVVTHEGEKTTLKTLIDKCEKGVVLFTYPKASTPGCTKQVCLFRDSHTPMTTAGLSIYGLSADSPKANTTFAVKQSLPYPLLCDPQQTLISAIGLKKIPKGTVRGVFVVDKQGKVLVAEAGSPSATHELVLGVVKSME